MQNSFTAGMQQAAAQYVTNQSTGPQERSRLSRISEALASLSGDMTSATEVLANAHIAMTGHSGAPLTGAAGALAGAQAGPVAIPGLLTDIEEWIGGANLRMGEIRRLADQIHELVRR